MLNRRQFSLSLGVSLGIAAAPSLFAETGNERARRVIDKCLYALGGDAFRNMRTRTESGRAYSFYREQLTGLSQAHLYTKYLDISPHAGEPDLGVVERQVFGKKQDDAVIFTGKEAWEVTFRGARPLPDDRVRQFRESTLHDVLYIFRQRLKEPGIEFDSGGADVVENQPVETVDIIDAQNRSVRVWINSDTWLPVKQRYYRWDPIINDRREEVTRYSKYRDVGNGVMWPFALERERDTEKIFELYSEMVTVNDAIADNLFELPRGVKILKK